MAVNIKSRELGKKYQFLTEGGEANIYVYDTDYLLKVFKDKVNLSLKESKVDLWLNSTVIDGFVSPVDKVYVEGIFKSYILENVKNSEVIATFSKKNYIKLQNIDNKDLVGLMLDASKKLENLHKSGKVVGDISDRNILVKLVNKLYQAYYIDCDSFGIGNLLADAYTETYTDPKAYDKSNNVIASKESDMYAFAILTFKLLTRLHPFKGTYEKNENLNTVERMKQKISVLGKHNIKVPNIIPSWKWISPELLNVMYEIFEKEKRDYLTNYLQELYDNMKYCNNHKNYYYSKYNECPLCNSDAKIKITPKVVIDDNDKSGLSIRVLLSNYNVNLLFDFDKYVDNNGYVIHILSKNKWKYSLNYRVEFSKDGKYVFEIYNDMIVIYNYEKRVKISSFKRAYKSNYKVRENHIYYIDEQFNLCKVQIVNSGVAKSNIMATYSNTLFEVEGKDNYFVAILYPKNMLIATKKGHVRLKYDGKINEYVIKYDKVSENWLFIYETNVGEHRTIVIQNNKIVFDSNIYKYAAEPLSNICFANNTIFAPSNKKIVGINYSKNLVKNFDIKIVTEESQLKFEKGGFKIITDNKIYYYGQ